MLQEEMMNENPVYVSEEMRDIVESVSTFSFKPIGPIADCVVSSELLQGPISQSFLSSYIVNSAEDAEKMRELFKAYKQPQPDLIVYPFDTPKYPIVETHHILSVENPILANLLIDFFGDKFSKGIAVHINIKKSAVCM